MTGVQDKVVIITGARSGIGESTAKKLAVKGARPIGLTAGKTGCNHW